MRMALSRIPHLRPTIVAVLLGGGLLWAYLPVFAEITSKWFNTPEYSHGYLVPVFSAYLLWRSRKQLDLTTMRPEWWGLVLLMAGVLLRLLGVFIHFSWLEAISLLPVLWGMALT